MRSFHWCCYNTKGSIGVGTEMTGHCNTGSTKERMTADRNRWCEMVYVNAMLQCENDERSPGFLACNDHFENHCYPPNFLGAMAHSRSSMELFLCGFFYASDPLELAVPESCCSSKARAYPVQLETFP